MPVILIDANMEGQAAHIWRRLQSSPWHELTSSLGVVFLTFRDINLGVAAPDSVVWRFCQENGYYLLTSNRNQDSDDSLEATIRREITADSLPVFTLPLPDRVHSPIFLERVVDKLLNFILDADNIRGTGRLFLS